VPGAIAIILIFLTILSAMAVLTLEFSQYIRSVQKANMAAIARSKESLRVSATLSGNTIVSLTVTNAGSAPSLIVAWVRINPADKSPRFEWLAEPVVVPILSNRTIPVSAPRGWSVGVLTSFGNIFWAKGSD
jgi:hypothetical protein